MQVTGKSAADLAGNVTETALYKAIDASPLKALPFGSAIAGFAKEQATNVANTVNKAVSRTTNKGGSSSSGGGGASGFGDMKPPTKPGGGSGAATRQYDMVKSNGLYFPMARLATNPEPYTFTLNTGIKAPVYSPLYQNSTLNNNASMRFCAFGVNYTSDNFSVSSFVQTVIYTVVQNAVQRAVNFSVGTTITSSGLTNWMNALINALNAYFYVKSILAYNQNPMNRNDAMVSLRSGISSTDLNSMYELERILLGTPIPPNLVNFCWWLNGNYQDGQLPNSMICKIYPNCSIPTYSSASGDFAHNINWSGLISGLNTYNYISVLMARAVPGWVKGELPSYPDLPVWDANWLTIFANIPVYGLDSFNTSGIIGPSIASSTTSWNYNTFTNELDGVAYALAAVYDSSNSAFLPTMASISKFTNGVSTTQYTNRLVWYSGQWQNANLNPYYAPLWTYEVTTAVTGTYTAVNIPGTQVVLGVNESSATQAALQLAEWLFSIDTIGYVKDNRVYDNKYNVTIGRPPRYGKGKRK